MRQYERSGVTIDQCTGCRGVFLDRGELERLADAESAYYAGQATYSGQATPPPAAGYRPPQQQAAMPPHGRWGSPGSPDSPDRYGSPNRYGHSRHRRGGFLGELFG